MVGAIYLPFALRLLRAGLATIAWGHPVRAGGYLDDYSYLLMGYMFDLRFLPCIT